MNKNHNIHIFTVISTICVAIFSFSALGAQESGAAGAASPLSPLYVCAAKTDSQERLACFDSAVAQLKAREASSEVVALDAPKVAQMRREAFGFNLPSLPKLGLPKFTKDKVEEPREERQTMVAVRIGRNGGYNTVHMENGQVWQLVETREVDLPRRPPVNVNIRSATMGSFILSFEGRNRGYRVRRTE